MVTVSNTPYAFATTNPTKLLFFNLDGSIISLKLFGDIEYKETISPEDFRLKNAPPGLTIASAVRASGKLVHLTLAFNDLALENDIHDFSISILASGLDKNFPLTSNDLSITAGISIEGIGYSFVTGKSYPMSIDIAGYNSKENKLFLNFILYTDKLISQDECVIIHYYLEVMNKLGNVLGNYGNYYNPQTITGLPGTNSARAENISVTLNSFLDPNYRIVITLLETRTT